jgi:hypothetical protein
MVEDLAHRYGARLLEFEDSQELAAFCRERGKPLEAEVVNGLLGIEPDELDRDDDPGPWSGSAPPAYLAQTRTRRARVIERLVEVGTPERAPSEEPQPDREREPARSAV